MTFLEIEGGAPLQGEILIPGAKNATLPMLCASLLTPEKCVFTNVPDISDIDNLLEIFQILGATVNRDKKLKIVEVEAKNIDPSKLANCKNVKKMRASILMLGPLLARFGRAEIALPGGCVIGARSNASHLDALQTLGADIAETSEKISGKFERKDFKNKWVLFSEASVTATENLAIFCAGVEDSAELYFTAAEPHVVATTKMLQAMGAEIGGIQTHHLSIKGKKNLKGGTFQIPPDGILVGTYAVAAAITNGNLLIKNVDHTELLSFYGALQRTGVHFDILDGALRVSPPHKLRAIPKVQTAIYPGFPTDLQSPFGVLLTQCEGDSMIFETLFENRLTYLAELEKMGAKIKILNPHQAVVSGPVALVGTEVQSWDLRSGAAVVLAGLIAQGKTRVSNVDYIDRGYENLDGNLRRLGAKISRGGSGK